MQFVSTFALVLMALTPDVVFSFTKATSTPLMFVGTKTVTTPSLPLPQTSTSMDIVNLATVNDNTKSLADFFKEDANRNLFLSEDGDVEVLNPSAELLKKWREKEREIPFPSHTKDDYEEHRSFVRVRTISSSFPGLKVVSENTILARMLAPRHFWGSRSSFSEYQFILLDSNLKAKGSGPMVWIFKKLTRKKSKNISSTKKQTEKESMAMSSFTRISAETSGSNNNNNNRHFFFRSSSTLKTKLNMPPALMKILPVSREKFEEQGSLSMQKCLDGVVEDALNRFRDRYVHWVSSK